MTEHEDKFMAAKQAENFDLLALAIEHAAEFGCRLENFEINNFGQVTRAYFQRIWDKKDASS